MRLGFILLSLAACASAPPAPVPAAPDAPSPAADPTLGVEIEPLAGPVWLHRTSHDTEDWGRVEANGVIVLGQRGAVLVDTGWDSQQARFLLDWIHEATGRDALAVIVTHSHDDRSAGIGAALERGIPVHGYRGTAGLLRDRGQPEPSAVFDEALELDLGGVTVEAFYPGAGHTADNSVVFVAGERLLFGGCLIRAAATSDLGNVADADVSAWPETVQRLIERYGGAQVVIPGHGAVGDASLLSHTRDLAERGP